VNIALSNELAAYADEIGVDFNTVRRAANTDGEANLLEPGIGVGGHCTPVYPHFLMQGARSAGLQLDMVALGRRINDEQPARQLHRLEKAFGPLRGRRVLILGLGFRPEVKEHVCSPAFQLRDELLRLGADVRLHDPLYTRAEIEGFGFASGSLDETPGYEVIVLNTAHPQYANLDFARLAKGGLRAVLDGRNFWNAQDARAAGITYIGIGGA
jgi:nucleotide sugar dehydrogenase